MHSNKLIRVMTALACDPWLIVPAVHKTICDIVRAHAAGPVSEASQHFAAAGMKANPQRREYALVDGTAVIPLEGIVGRKFDNVLYSSGVTSIDVWQRLVDTAAQDEEVDSILLTFDSPGGMVSGTPEAAAAVLRAKAAKPVLAYADGLMDSAAYWIGSQADAIYATQSADVGCIGCYLAILDTSRADEMAGYKLEMFRSGRFKGMGAAGTSLSDEQRAMLQADVDRIAAEFKVAVRGTRGAISDELMQGQSYSVEAALAHGLVDAVTDMDAALRDVADLKTIRANRRGAI